MRLITIYRGLVKVMVNLKFAVGLLTAITLVSIIATVLGGVYGEDVQMAIFRSAPFSALMIIFMTALVLAVASRRPWKKTHAGWIATHAGLILICCGHMATCHLGREGTVTLAEGQATSQMEQREWLLTADLRGRGERVKIRLPLEDLPVDQAIDGREYGLPGGDVLRVERYWPEFALRTSVTPDLRAEGGPLRPAIQVEVRAEGRKIATWLVADDPHEGAKGFGGALAVHHRRFEDPRAIDAILAGPGIDGDGPARAGRLLAVRGNDVLAEIPVEGAMAEARPLGESGFSVRISRRFERFRLVDRTPTDADTGDLNPALLIEVAGADGRKDHRWVFAAHGEVTAGDAMTLPFELRYAPGRADSELPPSSFIVLEAEGRQPVSIIVEPDGTRHAGPLVLGKAHALPWLGAEIAVIERYARAIVARVPWCASYTGRRPALLVSLLGAGAAPAAEGSRNWVVWNPTGEPATLAGAAGPVELRYGPNKVPLQFTIQLKDFVLETYEGTDNPKSFESFVRVTPHDGEPPFDYHIYMNHPLTYMGHTFFQSSYDPETLRTSTFQVSYDPGWPVVYLGYALTVLGLLFIVHVKPWLVRREAERLASAGLAKKAAGAAAAALVALLAFAPEARALEGVEVGAIAELAVQDNGRRKPLDTFARERIKFILGAERFEREEPVETLFSMIFAPEEWAGREAIKVHHPRLVELFGKKPGRRLSLAEIDASREFEAARAAVDPDAKLRGPFDNAVLELHHRRMIFHALADTMRVAPVPGAAPSAQWSPATHLDGQPPAARDAALGHLRAARKAWRAGDAAAASAALAGFAAEVRKMQAPLAPPAWKLAMERTLNRRQPLRIAYGVLAGAALLMGLSVVFRSRGAYIGGAVLLAAGAAVASAGLVARTIIVERAPVSNLYEASSFAVVAAVVAAAIFEAAYRNGLLGTAGAVFGALAALLIDIAGMDASIQPLVPVLRSYWLNIHVTAMLVSYAVFGIAFALAIYYFWKWFPAHGLPRATVALPLLAGALGVGRLIWRTAGHEMPSLNDYLIALVFAPAGGMALAWGLVRLHGTVKAAYESELELKTIERTLHRVCMVGFWIITAGVMLGAVWANESWGRYWGWDPKETWAFITWLVYAIYVHGRLAGTFRGAAGAIFSVVGFYSVLFTFYGVSFVLPGLHSYLKS